MTADATIILLGLRGSGKTTVARLLGERTGRSVIDLDDVTPTLLGGGSVRDVWASHGETAFREAETLALRQTLGESDRIVLALGGGTPTAPGASTALQAARAAGDHLFYLRAPAEALRTRLSDTDNGNRPALVGSDPLSEIDRVLASRDDLYRRLSTCVIETSGLTAHDVVELILAESNS